MAGAFSSTSARVPSSRARLDSAGLRALGIVAVSPLADAQDWLSWASFAGALGLWREEFALARAGALRLPAAPELRRCLNDALWNGGRYELVPAFADSIADERPSSADAWWFAGQAWLLRAESLRRTEDPERALAAYGESQARFERATALRAEYADSCRIYVALGWLGRGFAQARQDRRGEAAEALLQAVTLQPQLAGAQDGLGYDVLDLVDKILEWREPGPSPVDPLAWLDRIEAAAPGDPFWAIAISDSDLREALRADGRNPERAEQDTVDASGNPIRMRMGLPTSEGDAYLRASIAAGRRALSNAHTDEDRQAVAQADTIWAERMLERERLDGVHEALAEAAALLGLVPPERAADARALRAAAAELRSRLGEARPRQRVGR